MDAGNGDPDRLAREAIVDKGVSSALARAEGSHQLGSPIPPTSSLGTLFICTASASTVPSAASTSSSPKSNAVRARSGRRVIHTIRPSPSSSCPSPGLGECVGGECL